MITFLALIIPIYRYHFNQNYQIYIYCLAAFLLGMSMVFNSFKHSLYSFRITIFDLIISILVSYIILYQLILEQSFDLQIISRVLASAIIFLFFKVTKDKINSLFDIFILYGLIEVVIVLVEIIELYSFFPDSYHSINGSFGNPNVVAIFLALLIPISLYRNKTASRAKFLYLFLALLFISVIILTKCRSAILLSIFSIIALTLQYLNKLDTKRFVLGSIITLSLFLTFIFTSIEKKDSNTSRKLIWKTSFEMILDKPITGFGFSSFEKEYNLYQSIYLKKEPITQDELYTAGYILQPYNEFLNAWFSGGLFYFLIYYTTFVLSIYFLIKTFKDKNKQVLFISAVSIVGMYLISLFSYTFYMPVIEVFLFMHLGVLAANINPIKMIGIKQKVSIPLFFLSILFMGYHSASRLINNYQISKLIETPFNETEKQRKAFQRIYVSNNRNPQFLYNYALTLIKEKHYKEAILKLDIAKQYSAYFQLYYVSGVCYTLLGEYSHAEKNYITANSLYPSKFQPIYALFKLYIQLNNIEKARAIALKIDKMPVKKSSPKIEKIKNEIKIFINLQKP